MIFVGLTFWSRTSLRQSIRSSHPQTSPCLRVKVFTAAAMGIVSKTFAVCVGAHGIAAGDQTAHVIDALAICGRRYAAVWAGDDNLESRHNVAVITRAPIDFHCLAHDSNSILGRAILEDSKIDGSLLNER